MRRLIKMSLVLAVCSFIFAAFTFSTSAVDAQVSKVTSVKLEQLDNDSISVTWPAVSTASGYELYVSSDDGKTFTLLANGASTTYTYSGIQGFTNYQFKVVSYNGSTYAQESNLFAYYVNSTIEVFDLELEDVSSTTATISWDNITGATYTVEQYVLGQWKVVASNLTQSSYSFTSLASATNYNIRVMATMGSSQSDYAELSFTTATNISWSSVSGASSYIVCTYKSSNNTWTTLGATSNTYYDVEFDNSSATSVVYRIYAVSSGTSTSNAISYETIMTTSDSLGVSFDSTSTATFTWPSVANATSYVVKTKSLDGETWTTQATVSTTSANVNLAAQSVQTLIVEAYKGSTYLGNAVEEFSVYTPDLYYYTISDITSNGITAAYESLKSQLIYFTQVVNNTKYYTDAVTFTSDSYFSTEVTDVRLAGESLGDAMLEDMGMSLDDLSEEATETLSLNFDNGYVWSNKIKYTLSTIFVPFETDAYLYDSNVDNLSSLFIYNFELPSYGENYIEQLADGSYTMSFTITSESGVANYHEGFLTVFDASDLTTDDEFSIASIKYGATTINATFSADGLLTSLDVNSPFSATIEASMDSEDGVVKMAMDMNGQTVYSYTFTY